MELVVRGFPAPVKDQEHLNLVSILVGISQLFDDKTECGVQRFGLALNPYISHMKLHFLSFYFSIKPAAFQASGNAHMKLRLAGTLNRLNVEHRTSNIESSKGGSKIGHRVLMTLRFIDFKTNRRRIHLTEYIIRRWTFNVQCSFFS
jgi:hypothetical protein